MKVYKILFVALVILLVVSIVGMKFFDTRVIEDGDCYDKRGNVVQGISCDIETVYFYGINEIWFDSLALVTLIAMILSYGLELGYKVK